MNPALSRAVCLLAALSIASQADAALRKYRMRNTVIVSSPNANPNPDLIPQPIENPPLDRTLIEDGASPILRKLLFINPPGDGVTVFVPSLTTSLFVTNASRTAPGLFEPEPPSFTGTGGTSSTIRWGIVTGWTITGHEWCNSNPGVVCSLAGRMDEVTTDPVFDSEFYDLGTWTFHGTGFVTVPYVFRYNTSDFGNNQHWRRGFSEQDATVPVVPLAGLALVGGSIAAVAVGALRRRSR